MRQRLIHIAVFFAVLMQAAIPLGFMPSAQAGTAIVICSGVGEKTIRVDQNGQPVAPGEKDHDAPCLFTCQAAAPVIFSGYAFNAGPDVTQSVAMADHYRIAGHLFAALPEKTGPPRG